MTIEKHTRKRIWNIFLLLFLVLLFLITAMVAVLVFGDSTPFIQKRIEKLVYEKTNKTYHVQFENFHLNLRKKELSLTNFTLYPDSVAALDTSRNFVEFRTLEIYIRNIDLTKLIHNKELTASIFSLEKPTAKFTNGGEIDLGTFNNENISKGDSVKIPLFNKIKFDTLLIKNAHVNIDSIIAMKMKGKIPVINIEAIGFQIGGIKNTDLSFPFDVSDMYLKVEKIEQELPDSLHTLFAGELSFSLINKTIQAKNVSISPIDTLKETRRNLYTIAIPEISLLSKQVETLLHSDTISLENLTLNQPAIKIKFGVHAGGGIPLNEIDFYQFIENKIECVTIEDFAIQGASIELIPHNTSQTELSISMLNLDLLGFKADQHSFRDKQRVLSSMAFTLRFSHLELNHKDNIHRFEINDLKADTRSNMISTGKVSFQPISKNRTRKNITYVDVESKSLELRGFSFLDAYHRQIFPMKDLEIKGPRIKVLLKESKEKQINNANESLLLEKVNAYIRGIYVDNTRITQGFLNYAYHSTSSDENFFQTNFHFHLKKLSLDSVTFYQTDKLFFAREFNILFTKSGLNLGDKLHEITTDSIHLSSEGRSANIVNLKIQPTIADHHPDSLLKRNRSELYFVDFPAIHMTGANLHHALFNKELYISNIEITKPTIRVEKYGKWIQNEGSKMHKQSELFSLIDNFLYKIKVWEMNMTDGNIQFAQHQKGKSAFEFSNQFNIRFINFELDSLSVSRNNKLFYADDIDLTLRDQSFAMADGIHKLNAKEIAILSSKEQIFIRDAQLIPDVKSVPFQRAPIAFNAKIPLLLIDNADISALFNAGTLPVGNITLTNPDIEILFQSGIKKNTTDSVKMPLLIPKDFSEVNIRNISVDKGNLKLLNYDNGSSSVFARTSFLFTMNGFKVNRKGNEFVSEYRNFNISMENTLFDLPDKTNTLTVGKISFEQNESNLALENFSIKPIAVTTKNDEVINLKIQRLLLTNFNFDKFLDDRKLIGNKLVLTNPTIVTSGKSVNNKKKFSLYRLNLYAKINKQLEAIDVNDVEIINGEWITNEPGATKYNKIQLKGSGFRMDQNTDEKLRLLNFDRVELEIPNINGKTKDGYYTYKADLLKVNDTGNLYLQNFSLKPVYTREEHFSKKQFQDDYFTLAPTNIQISGLDMFNLLENDKWIMQKVLADFSSVNIFRDKRLPIHPKKFAKLPQQALRDLKKELYIDTLQTLCNQLTYNERETGTLSEGYVFFTNVDIRATNITNINEKMRSQPKTFVWFDGKFMGEANLKLKAELDLTSKNNEFSFEGHVPEMPLSLANPITEPNLKITIKEGINRDMKVFFVANEDSSLGRMFFAYNDLKVTILSEKKGELKEEKFISFLANTLAVKSDNPKHGTEVEPAYFKFHRDKQRSVINYCWKSIFSGMKSTLGLKEKDDKK